MSGASRKSAGHSKKTPAEYWVGSLRKSSGTLEMGATDTFTSAVKRPADDELAYLSTSHHLREKVGYERPPRRSGSVDPAARPAAGTPAYKSPEEYYDEVLELRRQLAYLEKDGALMRARLLRVEQDNQRKDKELEQLLDPSKGDDLRRALSDRRPESGAIVHSMKQKVLKLEQQLKDKESEHNTLKSNIKNTRIEELTLQMEMMYQEIVRLQNTSVSSTGAGSAGGGSAPGNKESSASASKVKALNDTILRMNDKNVRLTLENKTLKEDLEKLMARVAKSKDEPNQKPSSEIRDAIVSLESKMSKAGLDDSSSVTSSQAGLKKPAAAEGKLALEGTLEQRLDALDKRETALLVEIKKLNDVIKRLKEDRQHFRLKSDERGNEVKVLKKEIDTLTSEIQALRALERVKTPPAKTPASSHAEGSTDKRESLPSGRTTPKQTSVSARDEKSQDRDPADKRKSDEEQQKRIDKFTQEHAARKLQHGWMQYQQRRHDKESDEAAVTIQSMLRGHAARQSMLMAAKDEGRHSQSTDLDSAAVVIQSAMRAHSARHAVLGSEKSTKSSRASPSPAGSRSHSPKTLSGPSPAGSRSHSPKTASAKALRDDDDDDDDVVSTPKASLSRSSSRNSIKSAASRRPAPAKDDDEDDDDDIVF